MENAILRKLAAILSKAVMQNVRTNRRRILRLVKKAGIRGKLLACTTRATDSVLDFPLCSNLLRRDFSASAPDRAEASREVFDYIEFFYNTVRSHSYLGYGSPDEFEKLNAAA